MSCWVQVHGIAATMCFWKQVHDITATMSCWVQVHGTTATMCCWVQVHGITATMFCWVQVHGITATMCCWIQVHDITATMCCCIQVLGITATIIAGYKYTAAQHGQTDSVRAVAERKERMNTVNGIVGFRTRAIVRQWNSLLERRTLHNNRGKSEQSKKDMIPYNYIQGD